MMMREVCSLPQVNDMKISEITAVNAHCIESRKVHRHRNEIFWQLFLEIIKNSFEGKEEDKFLIKI
jgi:hypothetical protein